MADRDRPRQGRWRGLRLLPVGAETTVEELLRSAARHRDAGRILEAIADYERALAIRSAMPNSWYNLARLQRQAGRFEAALSSYEEALRRGISEPEEVHLERGVLFADDLARSEAAETELNRALELNPRYVPALLNLGNLHEDRGDRALARSAYKRALAIEPANVLALARVAGVADLSGADDPLLARLRTRIASSDPAGRADLGFALGAALDRLGAYDQAFEAYEAANQASRAAAGLRYDRHAQERFVDRLIAAFPEPVPAFVGEAGDRGEAPIFICGMFRSGSTLTEQILARHERVTPGGELGLIPALAERLRPYPEAVAASGPDRLAELRSAYLAGLRRIHPDADLVTDKRPDNFLHIGLIKSLFPEARIVHTRRNPADNILSLFFLHLDPAMTYAQDLGDAAHWFGQYRRLMAHWRRLYPDALFDMDYDALVAEPRASVEKLLEFCGLDWRDSCLSFHEAGNAVRTASAAQVREPLYTRSSGRWRNYERHLGCLIETLRGLERGD